MKNLLQSRTPAQLTQLREVVASAVGEDWRSISNTIFIDRYVDYCRTYRITAADLLASYPFLLITLT